MKYWFNALIRLGSLFLVLSGLSGLVAQSDNTEIVFVTGHYYYDIAIASSDEVALVTDASNTYAKLGTPQWSPDASRIAFTDHRIIYTVKVDGSDLVQLTDYEPLSGHSVRNISWSPDGRTIAATVHLTDESYKGYRIRLIDAETLAERDITSGDHSDGMSGLSWSPDGKYIVFTSNRNSRLLGATGLYVLDVETGEVSALTDVSIRRRDDRYPSWSPDGTQIAYVTENDAGGGWDIYLIDVNGSNRQRLTNRSNSPAVYFGGTIDWSPDGDRIVFTACDLYPEGCELFTIAVDGTDLRQITDDEDAGAFDPSWRPLPLEDAQPAGNCARH